MSYSDHLEGELLRFTFKAPDRAYAVAKLSVLGREVTVTGPIAGVGEGQRLSVDGQWVDDKKFGRQFKVERFLVEDPRTLMGMQRYLASVVPGVGEEIAARIVERFGLDTLRVLQATPEKLSEVRGVKPKTIESIQDALGESQAVQQLMVMLRGFDLPPGTSQRVLERFGRDAHAIIQRTPYRLTEVRGIGFRTADQIALANGVKPYAPERADAAIAFVLEGCEDEGSCFLPEAVVVERVAGFGVPHALGRERLDHLSEAGRVVRKDAIGERVWVEEERPVYRVAMDRLEANVARLLRVRVAAAVPLAVDLVAAQVRARITLSPEQASAVELALSGGVTVVTGGPGTGKTTIVRVLLAAAQQRDLKVLLGSPTGRAARRLAESCATAAGPADAKTIHRLLEFNPMTGGFNRGPDKPLEADLVLVDEASMLDLRLMDSLLGALAPRARLVLVGDVDQLPSVGAGRVLGDILAAAAEGATVPIARLTTIFRQAEESAIVKNAWRVNRGELPVSAEKDGGVTRDFFVLQEEDADDARALILRVLTERLPKLGFDPSRDVQVLTPMHNGPLGTTLLNQVLQDTLNPMVALQTQELVVGKRRFRVGDRILQTRNDYDLDVFNGDVGRVTDLTAAGLTADFDGRTISLSLVALETVEHAFAISIHKSQGSEYPAVIAVVHHSHYVMLRRNLLYTAMTRARKFVCLVSSGRGLSTAVVRQGEDNRWTALKERLCD